MRVRLIDGGTVEVTPCCDDPVAEIEPQRPLGADRQLPYPGAGSLYPGISARSSMGTPNSFSPASSRHQPHTQPA
jgi:hypothetical protein